MQLSDIDTLIQANARSVDGTYRPLFHLAAPTGWINDPNGFSVYKGRVHVFCQYYPFGAVWGLMHWGHWASADLIHWEWLPLALVADSPFDNYGCFSGTALEADEKLTLMYTGVHKNASGKMIEEQCIAQSADGVHFDKWTQNPVIGAEDLPEDGLPADFRDPKLMRTTDGYRALVANRSPDKGRLLLYSSQDLKTWRCDGTLIEDLSEMPECPDYFQLDGKDCLITCLMNQPSQGYRFQNEHHAVVYVLGRESNGVLTPEVMESIDLGPDFYAPETTQLPDGRRVMIGWMQMWGEDSPTHYLGHGWAGQYTLMRELSVRNGRLYQQPLRELQALRGEAFRLDNLTVEGTVMPQGLQARRFEIDLTLLVPEDGQAEIRLLGTAEEYFAIRYDAATQVLSTDRSRCGYTMATDDVPEHKPCGYAQLDGCASRLRLQIYVDTSSVEVFANDGVIAMSTLAFPKGSAEEISFSGHFTVESLTRWVLTVPEGPFI